LQGRPDPDITGKKFLKIGIPGVNRLIGVALIDPGSLNADRLANFHDESRPAVIFWRMSGKNLN